MLDLRFVRSNIYFVKLIFFICSTLFLFTPSSFGQLATPPLAFVSLQSPEPIPYGKSAAIVLDVSSFVSSLALTSLTSIATLPDPYTGVIYVDPEISAPSISCSVISCTATFTFTPTPNPLPFTVTRCGEANLQVHQALGANTDEDFILYLLICADVPPSSTPPITIIAQTVRAAQVVYNPQLSINSSSKNFDVVEGKSMSFEVSLSATNNQLFRAT